MFVFLDTEFTDLLSPELLSLGLVTLDGREHYGELDLSTETGQARVKASSDFVRHGGVLALWGRVPGAAGTQWEMGRRAGEWLLGLAEESNTRIEVAFDYSVDYELLPLDAVAGKTRVMEDAFITPNGTDVTDAFRLYLRPLLGSGMPDAFRLRTNPVAKVLRPG